MKKSNRFSRYVIIAICLSLIAASMSTAQVKSDLQSESFQEFLDSAPPLFQRMFMPRQLPENYDLKSAEEYLSWDWQEAIDIFWGPGLSKSLEQSYFQDTWDFIDGTFPAFNDLDPNVWQDVWDRYWPELEDTAATSKGRFCAIMQHAFVELGDDHAGIMDMDVISTQPAPGIPLYNGVAAGDNDHFGAALTTMPDSTIVVYQAIDAHPLGLVPGDIILGYEGVAWKDIYPQILAAELPMINPPYHTTEKTFTHTVFSSAGQNWHLFDTIDIVQYSTGDTLHLPTSLLNGANMSLWATEQLPVAGVHKPNPYHEEIFSWGYIEGTTIAYIYTHGWWGNESALLTKWENALDSIMHNTETSGLIIDDRANWGTALLTFLDPLNRLFDTTISVCNWYSRCSPTDHFDMCPNDDLGDFVKSIKGESDHFYNKPIAILTGHHAVSGGDFFPMAMSFHPMVKIFGKPTNGAFSTVGAGNWIYNNWIITITHTVCELADYPGEYLLRKVFPNPVDFPWVEFEEVWLTQEGVAEGRDDVVEAAIEWINNGDKDQDGIANSIDNCPGTHNPLQEDADGDGAGDVCDLYAGIDDFDDSDLDGVPYLYDNCPGISNSDQANSDNDSYGDLCDNCPDADNEDQADIDDDGIGDACDPCTDTDGDGWGNPGYAASVCPPDNCPDVFNIMQTDTDGDGIGDACEYICGNANGDDLVNVGDAVFLIGYIFREGAAPDPIQSGDANCDGLVNVGDAVYLINYIFRDGLEPCCP